MRRNRRKMGVLEMIGEKAMDFSGVLGMVAGIALIAYLTGHAVLAMGQAHQAGIEYIEAVQQAEEDSYQMGLLMEAVAQHREATPGIEVDPVSGGQQPPYWNAPETY